MTCDIKKIIVSLYLLPLVGFFTANAIKHYKNYYPCSVTWNYVSMSKEAGPNAINYYWLDSGAITIMQWQAHREGNKCNHPVVKNFLRDILKTRIQGEYQAQGIAGIEKRGITNGDISEDIKNNLLNQALGGVNFQCGSWDPYNPKRNLECKTYSSKELDDPKLGYTVNVAPRIEDEIK